MESIAIVVVAYDRVVSLNRLLNSLLRTNLINTPLIISIDKSKTNSVEKYAENFIWPYGEKTVIKHETNLGLRSHILSIGMLLDKYEAVIVLEDDIVVSPGFYDYAVAANAFYKDDDNIAGISLYNYQFNYQTFEPFNPLKTEYDVYFMQIAMSWGQVWMRKAWKQFYEWYKKENYKQLNDIEGFYSFKNWGEKSWLKYHIAYCIKQNKYFVYPYYSYSTNFADKGAHIASNLFVFQSSLKWCEKESSFKFPVFPDGVVYDAYNENKCLYEVLGISPSELVLDLADNKKDYADKKFLLTTKKLNYRIVKSFSLDFRPIELNIMINNQGKGIYLYDLSEHKRNREKSNIISLVSYKYRIHSLLAILHKIGMISILKLIFYKFCRS